jgi:hypothetical protein
MVARGEVVKTDYVSDVEALVVPEPTPDERNAVLAALEHAKAEPYASAWREAGLRENTEPDEP